MKIAIITVTRQGSLLGQKIATLLEKIPDNQVDLYVPARFSIPSSNSIPYQKPLAAVIEMIFNTKQALIMVMALGIVIRLIAPYLKSKRTDPAVVILDEKGKHVISALSGHLGGANKLTSLLAAELGTCPVITTATDVQNLTAIDLLAKEYKLVPEPFSEMTQINAALVNGDPVIVFTPFPLRLKPSPNLIIKDRDSFNYEHLDNKTRQVLITNLIMKPLKNTLLLRPKNLIIGIGCRKETPQERIKKLLEQALQQCRKSILSVKLLATVDLRANEPGLIGLAADLGVPLLTFSRDKIKDAFIKYPEVMQYSKFVNEKIGVGGVCEPVTLLACPQAKLIKSKTSQNGVTIAIAEES